MCLSDIRCQGPSLGGGIRARLEHLPVDMGQKAAKGAGSQGWGPARVSEIQGVSRAGRSKGPRETSPEEGLVRAPPMHTPQSQGHRTPDVPPEPQGVSPRCGGPPDSSRTPGPRQDRSTERAPQWASRLLTDLKWKTQLCADYQVGLRNPLPWGGAVGGQGGAGQPGDLGMAPKTGGRGPGTPPQWAPGPPGGSCQAKQQSWGESGPSSWLPPSGLLPTAPPHDT